MCRRWLAVDPNDAVAQHMACATDPEQQVPARANDTYVRKIFDVFASSFDEKLGSLDYSAPTLVTALLQSQPQCQSGRADVLVDGVVVGVHGTATVG